MAEEIQISMYEDIGRRKSIHDLPSYVSSGPTLSDILKLSLPEAVVKPKIRYSVSVVSIAVADSDLFYCRDSMTPRPLSNPNARSFHAEKRSLLKKSKGTGAPRSLMNAR
jgi:hypothetical protein